MIAKNPTKSKQGPKNIVFFVVIIIFVLTAVGFLILSNWKMYKRRADLNAQVESYKKQIEIMQKENSQIQSSLSQQDNSDYSEKEIRERLGLKKPGENVVIIVPPKNNGEVKPAEPQSLWQKILSNIKSLWD